MFLVLSDWTGRATAGAEVMSLQVVWIERGEVPAEEDDPPDVSGVIDKQVTARVVARRADVSATRGAMENSMIGETGERRQLNLSLPTAPLGFRQRLLERPETIRREPVIQVAFHDRSFGGMLQRMTLGGVCAELTKALLNNPGSFEAINNAMTRHGCDKQN